MPDTGKLHLPTGTKQQLFEEYKESLLPTDSAPSYRHFRRAWKESCTAIVQRTSSRFGMCDECATFDAQLKVATSPVEIATIRSDKAAHIKEQYQERDQYYIHRAVARQYPSKYLTVMLDGMDSNKLVVPHLRKAIKMIDHKACYKFSLMGAKVSSDQESNHMFVNNGRFMKNANGTFNALLPVLAEEHTRRGSLPDTLFLQLDNCPTENKSKAIYVLFASLVGFEVVKELYVNFMIKGHTHDAIDQTFSRVSKRISLQDTWTKEDLMAACLAATNEPTVVNDQTIHFDYVSWALGVPHAMAGVTKPHVLHFFRDAGGNVRLQTKEFSSDPDFLPAAGAVILTRESLAVLRSCPPPIVAALPCNYDDMERMLAKAEERHLLPPGVHKTWELFFATEKARDAAFCSECVRLRSLIADNAVSKRETKRDPETAAEKRRLQTQYRKEHKKHLMKELKRAQRSAGDAAAAAAGDPHFAAASVAWSRSFAQIAPGWKAGHLDDEPDSDGSDQEHGAQPVMEVQQPVLALQFGEDDEDDALQLQDTQATFRSQWHSSDTEGRVDAAGGAAMQAGQADSSSSPEDIEIVTSLDQGVVTVGAGGKANAGTVLKVQKPHPAPPSCMFNVNFMRAPRSDSWWHARLLRMMQLESVSTWDMSSRLGRAPTQT